MLYGQVCVDVEFGGGSVTTDPDNDDILPMTARDTIVSDCNMREVVPWPTYLGLFLRSRRVRMASDMTILLTVCGNNGMVADESGLKFEEKKACEQRIKDMQGWFATYCVETEALPNGNGST